MKPFKRYPYRTAARAVLTGIAAASLAWAGVAAAEQAATVHVDATRVENHVSAGMYAAFVEMMAEDVKWGLTAEMLHDRSFEQGADYLHLPAGWRLEPDTRNDNVGAIRFAQVEGTAYPAASQIGGAAEHSLKVMLDPEDITDPRRGFSQGRLFVHKGATYTGYVWIELPAEKPYAGSLRVELGEDVTDGAVYAHAVLPMAAPATPGAWRKYSFSLTSSTTDRFAKLSFLFDGKGTLFMDEASLEPAAAKDQVRPESEAAIAALHPSFIRWPGGNVAQDYHWQWGVGPRDLRPVFVNKSWSNAPEPNDFGTDEYLDFCQRLGIAPSITVNVGGDGATPTEAAAWVEYANGPVSSKYGAMRAANGHPAPYGVKQWELGNEIFGSWVRGHVTAEAYAQQAVTYAKAMRAVDPSIQLIAVGEGIFPERDAWNSAVLRIAGGSINYLAVHDYTSVTQNAKAANPRAEMMGRAEQFAAGYLHTAALIAQLAPGRGIRQIVNEWNLFYDLPTVEGMDGAVYAARMMNGFERDGDTVAANAVSDLLNGWIGGIIQVSRTGLYLTPQYQAVAMWKQHLGTDRVNATVDSPKLAPGVETVDAIATRSTDGQQLYLKLSNADDAHAVRVGLDVAGFAHTPAAQVELLSAANVHERNTFSNPGQVAPKREPLVCAKGCSISLPPDSVAVVTLNRR